MVRHVSILAGAVLAMAGAAQAAPILFITSMSGLNEAPMNNSPGFGSTSVWLDTAAHTMRIEATFGGLNPLTAAGAPSGTTAAHIHCCTAVPGVGVVGVATNTPSFTGFPLGVTAGVYTHTFDLTLASSWNAGFITNNGGTPAGAEAAFAAGMAAGRSYFNIHTNAFPGGEIRGFLALPEPSGRALAALGLTAVGVGSRRRRSLTAR